MIKKETITIYNLNSDITKTVIDEDYTQYKITDETEKRTILDEATIENLKITDIIITKSARKIFYYNKNEEIMYFGIGLDHANSDLSEKQLEEIINELGFTSYSISLTGYDYDASIIRLKLENKKMIEKEHCTIYNIKSDVKRRIEKEEVKYASGTIRKYEFIFYELEYNNKIINLDDVIIERLDITDIVALKDTNKIFYYNKPESKLFSDEKVFSNEINHIMEDLGFNSYSLYNAGYGYDEFIKCIELIK